MADSSLDQFFAKKDKSKKKTKGKMTSEQIAKKMEDSGKSAEKSLKKDKDKQENSSGKLSVTIPSLAQGEEEWNDFEEEKEVDYSGLRIQALTIAEKEKEEEAAREQQDEDGEDSQQAGDQQSGPWKVQQAPPAAAPPSPPPEPEPQAPPPPEPEPKEPTRSTYRPPHLRSGAALRNPAPQGTRRPVRQNYDFTSEEQFPTLGAAIDAKAPRREYADHSFTSVKHGLRNREDPSQHHLQLDLENKYSALHQTDGN
ncbi:protein CDV3 homolog [Amblyomma americanum]|uniref:Protein CDV3 homolog n=1 Tax=Amblyomma americanum TaxID=6943 RepID=A0AAQ4DAI6_AMBAM